MKWTAVPVPILWLAAAPSDDDDDVVGGVLRSTFCRVVHCSTERELLFLDKYPRGKAFGIESYYTRNCKHFIQQRRQSISCTNSCIVDGYVAPSPSISGNSNRYRVCHVFVVIS